MTTVSAAILKQDGKVLIARRRPDDGPTGGLWEFPGGKVRTGETPEEALLRECREELGINVSVGELVGRTIPDQGTMPAELLFFRAFLVSGEPGPRVHEEIRWVDVSELPTFPFPPADSSIIQILTR